MAANRAHAYASPTISRLRVGLRLPACHLFGAEEKRLTSPMVQTRYALVGCGHRAKTYLDAIAGEYSTGACVVGLCESNPGRAEMVRARVAKRFPDTACYHSDHFDRMKPVSTYDVAFQ